MRKKSHISLAGQIMNSMELDNVFDYRLPFYVGSIWPDCRPSFVTTPHKFDITFDDIERKISKFIANYDKDKGMNMRRCAGLGVIIHYIADYFTFPHNDHYPGNVKDHCYYERDLKFGMRAFLQTEEAAQIKEHVAAYDSVEELTSSRGSRRIRTGSALSRTAPSHSPRIRRKSIRIFTRSTSMPTWKASKKKSNALWICGSRRV